MGFLGTLKNFLSAAPQWETTEAKRVRLRKAWGLDESERAAHAPAAEATSDYDKTRWRRKLHQVFQNLPASRDQWPGLMTDAKSLNLDPSWMDAGMAEEFEQLLRAVVADRVVSEDEQEKIEVARRLIGLSEDEAATVLRAVAAEAEAFFGAEVKTQGD